MEQQALLHALTANRGDDTARLVYADWLDDQGDPTSRAKAAFLRLECRMALAPEKSLNRVLWRPVKDVQLIGTLELNGISFQDGLFTDPVLGPQKLSGLNALSAGTGVRLFFCDTLDVGGRTLRVIAVDGLRVARIWLSTPAETPAEPPVGGKI